MLENTIALTTSFAYAGVLLLLAFALAGGRTIPGASREWLGMVVFAMAGAISGLFPQVCADGINHGCLRAEWHFQLAASQYVHDGAGVIEFAGITLALWLATRRTQGERTGYRILGWAALAGYPVLGVSYLFDIDGGVIEGLFFIGFTAMVLLQLAERLRQPQGGDPLEPPLRLPQELSPDHNGDMMSRWEIARSPAPR